MRNDAKSVRVPLVTGVSGEAVLDFTMEDKSPKRAWFLISQSGAGVGTPRQVEPFLSSRGVKIMFPRCQRKLALQMGIHTYTAVFPAT